MNQIAKIFETTSVPPGGHGKVGIEIERSAFFKTGNPLPYSANSKTGEPGAETLLDKMASAFDWIEKKNSENRTLGLSNCFGSVTLEPGSQMELSSVVRDDLGSLAELVDRYEEKVSEITRPLGVVWYPFGVNPQNKVDEIELIPSPRYKIMTDYLSTRGALATQMMRLTTSVQVNLDYSDENEAIEMLRCSLAAAPISYALFASSPIALGKETGFLSYRREIWKKTDPDRVGILNEAFQPNFSFKEYAEYLWDRPLMFALDSEGNFHHAKGKSLKEISKKALPNIEADRANQAYAIRQLFTEARLKPGYVEVRSVDGLDPKTRYAAAAFWMGLLYSPAARKTTLKLLGGEDPSKRQALLELSVREGVNGSKDLHSMTGVLLDAAISGLQDRGLGEEKFLEPAREIFETKRNRAQEVLEYFRGPGKQNAKNLIQHFSIF